MLQWIDTLIGLVVILLTASLMVMILTQITSALLNLRGTNLKKGVEVLIGNTHKDLKEHAGQITIKALGHPLTSDTLSNYNRWNLATTIRPHELINILQILADSGTEPWQITLKKHLKEIEKSIEAWFDSIMDRVSQNFIQYTRIWTVVFSLLVIFILHLDFFRLFEQISNNSELRASLTLSADSILKRTDDISGISSAVPAIYTDAVRQLKEQDAAAGGLVDPPVFKSRSEGEKWLREQLGDNQKTDALLVRYSEIIETGLKDSINKLKDQTVSIKDELDKTKFKLIPEPYPGLSYGVNERHFWGVLIMAALTSLGAPFWFNTLKTLSSLRPIIAKKEDNERKTRESNPSS